MLVTTAPAFAQSGNDVNTRLNRIENEIDTLSRAVYRGETPPPSLFDADREDAASRAQTEVRFTQIEDTVRSLTGKVEEQDYQMRRMKDQLEKALMRIDALENLAKTPATAPAPQPMTNTNGGPVMTGPTNAATAAPATMNNADHGTLTGNDLAMPAGTDAGTPSAAAPVGTNAPTNTMGQLGNATALGPDDEYAQAFSLLKGKDYDAAQAAFEGFVKKYPDHNLAANAMYWLGETFYVRDNYEQAARIFAEAYQKYPDGPKGPDNLLKLALSLSGTGDKANACLTLKQIPRQYPAAGPVLNRAEQEKGKLGCN